MDFERVAHTVTEEMNERGTLDRLSDGVSQSLIFILGGSNKLLYFRERQCVFETTCTTGKRGFGEDFSSYKTPRGLHKVDRVVGKDSNPYSRIYQTRLYSEVTIPEPEFGENTHGMVGRLLTLKGLEPRINLNTPAREVYIHGTPHWWFWEEDPETYDINLRRSLGCIGLQPRMIQQLVDSDLDTKNDTFVYITEKEAA